MTRDHSVSATITWVRLVLTKEDPCWVKLNGAHGRFAKTVKAGIRPHSYRRWNADDETWEVHWKWVNWVVGVARKYYDEVDWSQLPDKWQMAAAGAQVAAGENQPVDASSPFEALSVAESAPDEVVKAAYKALAKIYHPDSPNGDSSKFRQIDDAYRKIKGIRGL